MWTWCSVEFPSRPIKNVETEKCKGILTKQKVDVSIYIAILLFWPLQCSLARKAIMKNITVYIHTYTFSYTHISNCYFYLPVKVFPHAWKMFNYFRVSIYRWYVGIVYGDRTHLYHRYFIKKKEKKKICPNENARPSHIYILNGLLWPLFHLQNDEKFNAIFKFNGKRNGLIKYTKSDLYIFLTVVRRPKEGRFR